jgi:hypothetical protein
MHKLLLAIKLLLSVTAHRGLQKRYALLRLVLLLQQQANLMRR